MFSSQNRLQVFCKMQTVTCISISPLHLQDRTNKHKLTCAISYTLSPQSHTKVSLIKIANLFVC